MPLKRKYPFCQKCGNPFTHNEHVFSKWCLNCNPKATVSKPVEIKPKLVAPGTYDVKFFDANLTVKCSCGKEVDIIMGKHQAFEMVCPDCRTRFEPRLDVYAFKPLD